MKMYLGLTKRNMLVYLKDKQAILFSLLTSIIVFALYLLFLRNTFIDAINQALAEAPMIRELIRDEDLNMFTNIKLLVGIIGSAAITIPFSCLTTVTRDRENKVDQDILATPVRRWQIILAYFTASSLCAILMTFVIMTIGLVILQQFGNLYITVPGILKAYGVTALGCVSSTALFMNIVLFFKSGSASGAFFGILLVACHRLFGGLGDTVHGFFDFRHCGDIVHHGFVFDDATEAIEPASAFGAVMVIGICLEERIVGR